MTLAIALFVTGCATAPSPAGPDVPVPPPDGSASSHDEAPLPADEPASAGGPVAEGEPASAGGPVAEGEPVSAGGTVAEGEPVPAGDTIRPESSIPMRSAPENPDRSDVPTRRTPESRSLAEPVPVPDAGLVAAPEPEAPSPVAARGPHGLHEPELVRPAPDSLDRVDHDESAVSSPGGPSSTRSERPAGPSRPPHDWHDERQQEPPHSAVAVAADSAEAGIPDSTVNSTVDRAAVAAADSTPDSTVDRAAGGAAGRTPDSTADRVVHAAAGSGSDSVTNRNTEAAAGGTSDGTAGSTADAVAQRRQATVTHDAISDPRPETEEGRNRVETASREPDGDPRGVETRPAPEQGGGSAAGWNERAAAVASGTEIAIILPGRGWLYVGKEYGDGAIRLLGKGRDGSDDLFRFRVEEPGDYGLWFQQQNAVTGELVNERLGLRASPSSAAVDVSVDELPLGGSIAELPQAVEPAASGVSSMIASAREDPERGPGATAERGPGATAERGAESAPETDSLQGGSLEQEGASERVSPEQLSSERIASGLLEDGRTAEAVGELVAALEAGSLGADGIGDELYADLAGLAGSEPGAGEVLRAFWRLIAASGSSRAPLARRELFEIAINRGGADEVLEAVRLLEGADELDGTDLREAMAATADSASASALPILARGLPAAGDPARTMRSLGDRRLFELARLLEAPGEMRDLRQAAVLYRQIIEERPLSPFWERSRARLEYLERHYFDVR